MSKKIKISRHTLYVYVAVIAFVTGSSAYIKNINILGLLIDAIEAIVLGLCVLEALKNKRISKYSLLVTAFYGLLGISTVRGSQEYVALLVYAVQGIGATVFMESEIKRDAKGVIKALRNVLSIVLLLNLISVLVNKSTASTTLYLLGYRIAFSPFVICSVFFSMLYDQLNDYIGLSKFTILSLSLGFLTLFMRNVSTGIVSLAVALILLVISKKRTQMFNMQMFFAVYAIAFIAIIIFEVQYHIPALSYFLTDILGKDLLFNNRTYIWRGAIRQFLERPVWGWGASSGGLVNVEFVYRVAELNAHNQILNLLCEGGLFSFGIFTGMVLHISKIIDQYQKCYLGRLTMCFFISFFVIMLMEVQMTKALIFLTFASAASLPYLIEAHQEVLQKKESIV